MHYLYKITDIFNNKVYIGQSNKENERWRQHKYFARQDEPIQYVHRAMKKYGVSNFTYEVIAMCQSQEDANWTETELIKQYDSQNKEHGYNIAPGGDHAWNAGLPAEQQPMYGKHHTEKSKVQISESNMGKKNPHSEEWSAKLSKIMIGRIITDEWKDKISESNRGKIVPISSKKKMSLAKIGTSLSKETKEKISKSMRSIVKPIDFGRKISAARRLFSDEQEEKIRGERKIKSVKEIAGQYGCSIDVIYRILRK